MIETSVKDESMAAQDPYAELSEGTTVRKPQKYPLLVVTVRIEPSEVQ
jgi:hypothetical protein